MSISVSSMNTCYLRNLIYSHHIARFGERTLLDGNQENMQAVIDKMTNKVVLKLLLLNVCSKNVCSVCKVIHFLIGAVTSEMPPTTVSLHCHSRRRQRRHIVRITTACITICYRYSFVERKCVKHYTILQLLAQN